MDLSKSFDTVCHVRLLSILDQIGIKGKPFKLFESYLSGRTQRVKLKIPHKIINEINIVNNCEVVEEKIFLNTELHSDEINCAPYSVPQGTVLSPILYNIYVSALNNLPLQGQLVSFADDTALRIRGNTWEEVFTSTQRDMSLIKNWFAYHNLYLNMEKTKIVPFCMDKRSLPNTESIKIHEHRCSLNLDYWVDHLAIDCQCSHIELTNSCRYLGVVIDSHLRWDVHIMGMVKRLRSYSFLFRTLRSFLNLKLLKQFYFALVQSVLEYGICCYGRADPTTLQHLKIAQNCVLKIIFWKDSMYSTRKLYEELEVLSLTNLFYKNIVVHIHKNREKYIQYSDHPYKLRKNNLIIQYCKTKKGQKSLNHLGIKIYQKLPDSIKEEENKSFKNKIKDWLKQNEIGAK